MFARKRSTPPVRTTHASPVLAGGLPPWRSSLVLALLSCGFLLLAGRAAWIQVIDQAFYDEQGRRRVVRELAMPAARGNIVDRHGRLLALSRPVRTVYAMPSTFDEPLGEPQRNALAALLKMPRGKLDPLLDSDRAFVYLKHQVEPDVAERIAALGIPAVRSHEAWRRSYPEGEASAQLLGFMGLDGTPLEGLERVLDASLRAEPGRRTVIRNRVGEIVDNEVQVQPQPGTTVRLTIDAGLQQATYRALKEAALQHGAQGAGAVVLDAVTGDILALTNWPSFDVDDPAARSSARVRNRVVTDLFEPGSTIKPVHLAQALERRWVRPDTMVDVAPGWTQVGRFVVRDTRRFDQLSVADIIRHSSNVGMVRVLATRPREDIWHWLRETGFGSRPPTELPGAASGRLLAPTAWSGTDQAAMSYGYGFSASLLQLARAYTMFGPHGRPLALRIVADLASGPESGPVFDPESGPVFDPVADPEAGATSVTGVTGASGARAEPGGTPAGGFLAARHSQPGAVPLSMIHMPPERLLSESTTAAIRAMLGGAASATGTAQRAQLDHYEVGAKTGTTRKLAGRHYAKGAYIATTIGLAPLHAPRYVVAVMIDEPHGVLRGGAAVAAPVFAEIMAAALRSGGIAPDRRRVPVRGVASR